MTTPAIERASGLFGALGLAVGGLTAKLRRWRARRRVSPVWTAAAAIVLLLIGLPLATLVVLALSPAENIWPHLAANVLPRALVDTLLLLAGVGLLTACAGTAAAWVVTMYRFPGRALVDRLLIIPLAMPTYIVAYCYADLFGYAGPVQAALRGLFGWADARAYWFPDVRSTGGAVFILSSVLYPYVYLTARASFVQQSVCVLEVARTLGCTPLATLVRVALPLARPAIAAGVALALMECLNDIGAVQYLGVETLTLSVYATWLQRSSLAGAAQISVVLLLFVVAVFAVERAGRSRAQFHHTTGRYRSIPFSDIEGWRGVAVCLLCALPFVAGFGVPFVVLAANALTTAGPAASGLWRAAANSIMLAAATAAVAVALAVLVAYARRIAPNSLTRPAIRIAGLGYAVPGTVLALGLLLPLAAFDNAVDSLARSTLGVPLGLVLSGSLAALILALTIRFLAVALGSIEAGFERISPNLDAAARALGESAVSTLHRIHLPLLMPALGAGGLLVFVDAMKELPATLLLRPFNFETLATHVFSLAALEQFEQAAFGALMIVLAGLAPVLLLHHAVAGGRAGAGRG